MTTLLRREVLPFLAVVGLLVAVLVGAAAYVGQDLALPGAVAVSAVAAGVVRAARHPRPSPAPPSPSVATIETPGGAGEAAALWAVHSLYAVAAAVPLDAAVDGRALRRLAGRLAATVALVVPVVLLVLFAAAVSPGGDGIRAVGVAAAAAVCAVPVYLLRSGEQRPSPRSHG